MKKYLRTTYFFLLAGIVMLSGIFLQTMPVTHAASQYMDYFQAMPMISSLSSSCWGAAAVGPRDQSNGLEDKTMTQYCYWDGGIIKGSDGLYHMYASRWNQSGGHNGWFGSVAVHATSSNLYGPYTDKGLCWPNNQNGKGHNVFPFVGGDGKFYIIVSDTRPGDIFQATSLNGPWTQLGTLSSSGNFGQTANISVMYRPDGRYMAVPRSGVIAISNNVLGTYVVQGTSSYVQAGVPSGNLEDPVVWYSGGKYHIVVNKWDTRKAYHITSTDGITGWKLDPGLAYDPTANFLRYTNGTVNRWNKLERFNVYMENGHVVATLLSAIDVPKDQDRGNDSHGSKVIVIPFDGTSLDGGPTPTPTRPGTPTPTPIPGTISIAAGSTSVVGSFQADQYYSGGSTYNNTNTVDVSQITSNPPPAALFNNERYGAMSYTIPGFSTGNSYTVTLYFAETYLTSSGSRLFNVSINGATVLSNFDIYASAGGQNKAIARSFTSTANTSGQIVIQFASVTENPKINGISIKPGGPNPTPTPSATPTPTPSSTVTPTGIVNTPTPTPTGYSISIAAGRTSALGSFQADQYYSGGSTYSNSNTVDVSQITSNPPSAALFNNERYGAMSYTIPGFTAGSSYTVTLYFAETYLTASGRRLFNVSINSTTVLSSFDIYATAGGQNKAIARSFTATANSSGQIVIQFTSGTENPKINGISIKSN